jgi:outer membrane receptor for Fe3+-dicitrate
VLAKRPTNARKQIELLMRSKRRTNACKDTYYSVSIPALFVAWHLVCEWTVLRRIKAMFRYSGSVKDVKGLLRVSRVY